MMVDVVTVGIFWTSWDRIVGYLGFILYDHKTNNQPPITVYNQENTNKVFPTIKPRLMDPQK